jgi:hypothetical protein
MRIGKRIIWAAALGLAATAMHPGGAAPALAASPTAAAPTDVTSQQRRRIPRITVVPLSRYYRKCDFWLAVEHRPSGDVITPQQHCWWALR